MTLRVRRPTWILHGLGVGLRRLPPPLRLACCCRAGDDDLRAAALEGRRAGRFGEAEDDLEDEDEDEEELEEADELLEDELRLDELPPLPPPLAALLERELLLEALRFFLEAGRPRSFLVSGRTRLGLAAIVRYDF